MEPVGDDVRKRRRVDETLARFSAAHDEFEDEQRRKRERRAPVPSGPSTKDDEKPETRLQEKKSRKRERTKLAGKTLAAIIAAVVFLATGLAWGFKSWVDDKFRQVSALDENSSAIQNAEGQRGDENFLIVGSDTRAGAEAGEGVGSESQIAGARSDTVMIAHVPANRERVVMVSFPRDLEVNRPECERFDHKAANYTSEKLPAKGPVKLNSVYQLGGPRCVTKVTQELSGLRINHFVGIDFHGFKDMVDAVRGVDVCVERPLKDGKLGLIVPEKGKAVTLTGDQALNFVRAREVIGDPTSDYGRIKRQQRFLSALLRKSMSSKVLFDIGQLTAFVNAFAKSTFGDNVDTDQLLKLGQSLQGLEAGRVTFVTVPTVGESNSRGNEVLRGPDTRALFDAIIGDTPLPGEARGGTGNGQAAPPTPAPAGHTGPSGHTPTQDEPTREDYAPADPRQIKLQVLNGGNTRERIATRTADELRKHGFQVTRVDNSNERVQRTTIRYGPNQLNAARTLAGSVPNALLQEDQSLAGTLQLVLGPEFNGDIAAPKPGQAPLPGDLSTINGADVSCS